MRNATMIPWGLALGMLVLGVGPAQAQPHRATRLGNPATRFADPLRSPNDLRARFRDPKLRPDIAAVVRLAGWPGRLQDLYQAAADNPITAIELPVGSRMPYMSTRRKGRPIILRDVLWAGKQPISAYAFTFSSNGRRYRCVTPKPCSNFFLEALGSPQLALGCEAPAETRTGGRVEVCFTLRNKGDAAEAKAVVTLPVPVGAEYVNPTAGRQPSAHELIWRIPTLAPGETKRFCATFVMRRSGLISFAPTASGTLARPVQSTCSTRVEGISAIQLEVVDLADPVELGGQATYSIRVLNQGSVTGTNVRLLCRLPAGQEFVSAKGTTQARAQAGLVRMEPISELSPKAEASWQLVVKATQAGDTRFRVELSSDQFREPIVEEESTQQY